MSDMYTPEAWIECKKPCSDCPMLKSEKDRDCKHIWRNIIDMAQDKDERTIPDTAVVTAFENGATISDVAIGGKRPSILVSDFPPVPDERYFQLKVLRTEPKNVDDLSMGQLIEVYDLVDSDPMEIPISMISKIRSGVLKIGINACDEYLIDVATNGSTHELLAVLAVLLRDFDQANDTIN